MQPLCGVGTRHWQPDSAVCSPSRDSCPPASLGAVPLLWQPTRPGQPLNLDDPRSGSVRSACSRMLPVPHVGACRADKAWCQPHSVCESAGHQAGCRHLLQYRACSAAWHRAMSQSPLRLNAGSYVVPVHLRHSGQKQCISRRVSGHRRQDCGALHVVPAAVKMQRHPVVLCQ